ncbi:MBL fold metallo-hydrolase [Brevibacterium daeguense]|uniref:MBL fold metallo-hydrolase n=1 Tax=Brevibacterium daeguense TaxID=909936 RepID=A0ABP8EKW5_9MICO|nr:MBL fold metallo-hydrolase [Brevibacterium daeguense]
MEIESLSSEQRQAWRDRVLPPVQTVSEGVWAIPVPIPNNPLVYTYCYAIAEDSGVALIDPGWDGKEQLEALTAGLSQAGFALKDITGIAVSHYHRDHIGLVPALFQRNPDMWLALQSNDIATLDTFRKQEKGAVTGATGEKTIAEIYGVPAQRRDELAHLDARKRADHFTVPHWPHEFVVLSDNDVLPIRGRKVESLWTPGHTYGHSAFLDAEAGVFFSGDHVLPTITPNIGLDAPSITHSLADYLGSLERMSKLDEDVTVAPAHGFRFRGLQVRAEQIAGHHDERLAEIRARWAEVDDHSVYAIAQGLHWSRGFEGLQNFNLFAALAETAAHMYYLGLPVGEPAIA